MAKNVTRALVYRRELTTGAGDDSADRRSTHSKFAPLHAMIAEAKRTNMAALMVQSPQMLGDTYEELLTNLDAIAAADLALMMVPPLHRAL